MSWYAALLIANGWFMRAQGLPSARHIKIAGLRLLGFVVAWLVAFAWLPTLPVAVALAGWVAFIIPKMPPSSWLIAFIRFLTLATGV